MGQSLHLQFRPRRELGRTGFFATVLGIGDLADRKLPLETCVATLQRALDAGLNVVDTAPGYEDGYSEQIVAEAMKAVSNRDSVFVIDKIDQLEQDVGPQINVSLQRLGLDYADAFVFHGLSSMDVYERLCQPGGGFDQLADCITSGMARYGGISSHNPDVLDAAIRAGVCDIVMFPVGPFVNSRYVSTILPLAKSNHLGTVCFKTFGAGKLLGDTQGYNQPFQVRPRGKVSSGGTGDPVSMLPRLTVADCVHYTLTFDPDVALLGLSYPNEQDAAFTAARAFARLSDTELDDIRARALEARRDKGPCWWNPDPEA